jgi:putative colanic acid biosynthesis UDP-glucose lipid carrier transferase
MRKRIELDLAYMRHWSLWLDVRILLKTVSVVLTDSRAY